MNSSNSLMPRTTTIRSHLTRKNLFSMIQNYKRLKKICSRPKSRTFLLGEEEVSYFHVIRDLRGWISSEVQELQLSERLMDEGARDRKLLQLSLIKDEMICSNTKQMKFGSVWVWDSSWVLWLNIPWTRKNFIHHCYVSNHLSREGI